MLSHLFRKFVPMRLPEPATRVRTEGYTWKVLPTGIKLFGSAGPAWESWDAKVVKENLQRTILRAELPGGTVFIKRCRVNTPRAWMRETVRPAKARLEFENALLLRAKGIDCIEPLAWGLWRGMLPGESIILTREHPNTVLLEEAIQQPLELHERRALTVEFARFLAKMHNAGVSHPDPHPGNFLVQMGGEPKFALLDVHGVRFGRPLAWPAALANLVLINRWFQVRSARTDRARFWKAYAEVRTGLGKAEAREVETRTLDSNREFWRTRDARYLGTNRQFLCFPKGHSFRELAPEHLFDCFIPEANPCDSAGHQYERSLMLLKNSPSTTVVDVEENSGRRMIVKKFKLKKRFAILANAFRPSPARRSWLNGHHLLDRQIPTARPIAYRYETRFGIEAEGVVAFEKVPDACDLLESVERGIADVEKIARLLRTMHDRDVRHRDLKATNILISHGEPVLIDLVGVTVKGRVVAAARQMDLSRLAVSFLRHPKVRHADRLRFLRHYMMWAPANWGDWKVWWKKIAVHVSAKVERNRRTGRPLA